MARSCEMAPAAAMLEAPITTDEEMPRVPMASIPPGKWVRMLLSTQETNQADIARHLKEPESTVSRVLDGVYFTKTPKGQAKRDRIEKYIAELLDVPRAELFPRLEQASATRKKKGKR